MIAIVSATALDTRRIRVVFDGDAPVGNPADANDATNPANWTIAGQAPGPVATVAAETVEAVGAMATVDEEPRVAFAVWPTVPTANETIILFCTHPRQPGGAGALQQPTSLVVGSRHVGPEDIQAVTLLFLNHNQLSAANGLRVYAWASKTGLWYEVDLPDENDAPTIGANAEIQVPVLTNSTIWRERLEVADLEGVAVEYTAGATPPTEWVGSIALHVNCASVGL